MAKKKSDAIAFVKWLMENDYDLDGHWELQYHVKKWIKKYISYEMHEVSTVYNLFLESQKATK